MWNMRQALPTSRLSVRNIFLLAASLAATIFATLLAVTSPVAAETNADVTWQDSNLIYQDKTYRGPTVANERAGYDLPSGTITYVNLDSPMQWGSKEIGVIYFPADSSPEKATTAHYVTYKQTGGSLSNKSDPIEISMDSTGAPEVQGGEAEEASSCQVRGIGYIICPITTFFAEGMDWIFDVLKQFVEVAPLSTDPNSGMRRAWEVMRTFANVAFVIGFIIIIYSQLTSVGLTNYGIKKLLPRIIIAAILVNVSYWVCVIAVDMSNILGNSLQEIFIGLRELVGINNKAPVDWSDLTMFILSGGALGTIAVGGLITGAAAIGSIGGLVFLLLPILVGAATTVLVVVFILAARQAIITLLVIIAPLAFVAYLLPNTEKWFEKWRSLFMTMLIFFPAFSLVFGGSQFAGAMIIDSAGSNIVLMILGMAVQIAPLAITPLLLKLSGTLLSRIGGLVNDPTRGVKDRTKNWSKDRREAYRSNQMAKTRQMAREGKLKGRHVVRRSAMNSDNLRRRREANKSASDTSADTLFQQSKEGKSIDALTRTVEREKQIVQNELDRAWSVKAKIDTTSLERELTLRVTNSEAEQAKAAVESMYVASTAFNNDSIKAGLSDADHRAEQQRIRKDQAKVYEAIYGGNFENDTRDDKASVDERLAMLNRSSNASKFVALEGIRRSEAERVSRSRVSDALHKNKDTVDGKQILEYAAGIGSTELVQSDTISKVRREFVEHRDAQTQLMQHFKLDSANYQDLALRKSDVTVEDDNGTKHTFSANNAHVIEAALDQQKSAASFSQKLEIIEASGASRDAAGKVIDKGALYDYRDTVQDIAKSMVGAAPFANDKSLNAVIKGEYLGRKSTEYHSIRQIFEGRIKSEAVSLANNGAMDIMFKAGKDSKAIDHFFNTDPTFRGYSAAEKAEARAKFQTNFTELKYNAHDVLNDPLLTKNANKELRDVLGSNMMERPKKSTP